MFSDVVKFYIVIIASIKCFYAGEQIYSWPQESEDNVVCNFINKFKYSMCHILVPFYIENIIIFRFFDINSTMVMEIGVR